MISNSTITSVSLCGSEQQIYLLKEKVIESDKSWLSIEMEKIEEKVAILELETLRCNNIVLFCRRRRRRGTPPPTVPVARASEGKPPEGREALDGSGREATLRSSPHIPDSDPPIHRNAHDSFPPRRRRVQCRGGCPV